MEFLNHDSNALDKFSHHGIFSTYSSALHNGIHQMSLTTNTQSALWALRHNFKSTRKSYPNASLDVALIGGYDSIYRDPFGKTTMI